MRRGTGHVPEILAGTALAVWLGCGLLPFYGYFIDELYYVACSNRLDWGYVDHPPLSILLLRISRAVLGDGRLALRLPAALAGALTVWLTARLARRLGASGLGQGVAGGAVLAAPIFSVFFGFYSMNAFEALLWTGCAAVLVEIELRNEPRLWLLFGLLAGIGLENKHTVVLLAAGLAAGLVLTPARRHLRSRWLWLGAAIAALLALPNLLWQATHGFVTLEFYREADRIKNVPTPPLVAVLQQVLFVNPATLPLWLAGAWFLFRRRPGGDLRHLGWLYATLLAIVAASQKSRPDRIAAIYPLLFAAGGAALDEASRAPRRRWLRAAAPAWLALAALAVAPVSLPILPPPALARVAPYFGGSQQFERGEGKRAPVPQFFSDRLEWERLVDDVAAVASALPVEDRARAVLFAPDYGPAAALEWLGRGRGIPPVYCAHNSYHSWGPPPDPVDVAIVLGETEDRLRERFEDVRLAAIHDCEYCAVWRDRMPIWIARRAKVRFRDAWPEMRHLE